MTQGPGQYGEQDPWVGDPASGRAWGAKGDGGAGQGWPYGGQSSPGQYPGGAYPGQPYPGQARPHPGQAFPGEVYTSGLPPGQPYPGQPSDGRYPGVPYPGGAWSGQSGPYDAYGQPAPWTGYPAPGYAYPLPHQRFRPGGVTAAAVLAFVQSGFLLIAGLFVLAGADVAGIVEESGVGLDDEFTVVALLTWLATGLLIAGGAQVFNGRRGLLIGGCALSLALSVYWLVRILGEVAVRGVVAWPFLFAVLPIISICMVSTAVVRQWAATVAPSQG